MAAETEDRIRTRAYQLWEEAGRPHGAHDQHWSQAEREIAPPATGGEGGAPSQDDRARTAPKGGTPGIPAAGPVPVTPRDPDAAKSPRGR